jgi:uncharacterized protein
MNASEAPDFSQYGFLYQSNLIMSYVGGSKAHGAKIDDTDDTDWYGVFIEPPERIIGIDPIEHFCYTTGGQPGGNGARDVDVVLYSLRKWAGLAVKGNPSALHFLFAPLDFRTIWWDWVADKPEIFMAKGHLKPFLGFADDQLKRLLGQKGQKNVHRAHLEKQFGYDTKYAMHIIRLYGEAKELMETGKITLPRPNAAELIEIRNGKYKLHEIQAWARQLEDETVRASDSGPLPGRVDRDTVSMLISTVYRKFWNNDAQPPTAA